MYAAAAATTTAETLIWQENFGKFAILKNVGKITWCLKSRREWWLTLFTQIVLGRYDTAKSKNLGWFRMLLTFWRWNDGHTRAVSLT